MENRNGLEISAGEYTPDVVTERDKRNAGQVGRTAALLFLAHMRHDHRHRSSAESLNYTWMLRIETADLIDKGRICLLGTFG